MRRLKGSSLIETIVSAVLFMIVFILAMELLPRLAIHTDNALLLAEAEYRIRCASQHYGTGRCEYKTYVERYVWGEVVISLRPYRNMCNIQLMSVEAHFTGHPKSVTHQQLIQWRE